MKDNVPGNAPLEMIVYLNRSFSVRLQKVRNENQYEVRLQFSVDQSRSKEKKHHGD